MLLLPALFRTTFSLSVGQVDAGRRNCRSNGFVSRPSHMINDEKCGKHVGLSNFSTNLFLCRKRARDFARPSHKSRVRNAQTDSRHSLIASRTLAGEPGTPPCLHLSLKETQPVDTISALRFLHVQVVLLFRC